MTKIDRFPPLKIMTLNTKINIKSIKRVIQQPQKIKKVQEETTRRVFNIVENLFKPNVTSNSMRKCFFSLSPWEANFTVVCKETSIK